MIHKGSTGKPCRTNFTDSKKQGAIEGPIRIPVHSPLFLISTLAFPSISSKSLKFHSVLFSIQHFFYCIPIGTVASRYGKPIGATRRDNGRTSGRLARHAGLDGVEDAAGAGPVARVRDCAPDGTDQRPPAGGELRNAVPRPAEAGAGGLHFLRVGRVRQQS